MHGDTYQPLFEHLLYNGQGEIGMTFGQVEKVLGRKLPASARNRASWWSNNPTGHSQAANGWLRAGYRATEIDLVKERVKFTLEGWPDGYSKVSWPIAPEGLGEMGQSPLQTSTPIAAPDKPSDQIDADKPHPAWGIWVGKVLLLPDYDYTQPADPDWGKVYDD